jgi:serine/threonine-protein kinase
MTAGLSPSDSLVGRVLAERYQILHRLGEGAMGVVYKARHVKVGRLFAVKVLHRRAFEDGKVVLRFEREAELAGRLRHPNVIGVVDVGEVDGTRYMVMDFVEGPDLARLLDEAPMRSQRIIRLVRQMLEGLHHAHEQGLIHRDFKPENVIVERDGHGGELPRIVDFGIALLCEGGDSADGKGRLTTNGLVLGTPHYMAPEQAVADPIDHRIDLFALGIVIYEMLSGRLPYDGSGAEVARANLLIDPPPIRQRVPHLEVDPLLEAFARRLMAKKRDARPPTARAARELLDLIDRDRLAAAVALGVPVARSGLGATTERVDAEPTVDQWQTTTRMKPTPRSGDPVVAAPAAPPGSATGTPLPLPGAATEAGVPAWLAPGAGANVPHAVDAAGVPYPVEVVGAPYPASAGGEPVPVAAGRVPSPATGTGIPYPVGGAGSGLVGGAGSGLVGGTAVAAAGSGAAAMASPILYAGQAQGASRGRGRRVRDTAIRTPLGWQSASLPGRRRSWLIGGAVVGTAGLVVAAALTLAAADQDGADSVEPTANAALQPASRAPALPPPAVAPTRLAEAPTPPAAVPAPTVPPAPTAAIDARPVPEAPSAAALPANPPATRAPVRAASTSKPAASSGSVRGKPGAAPRAPVAPVAPASDPLPRAESPRTEPQRAEPPRAEPPRTELQHTEPMSPPSGASSGALGVLVEQFQKEIQDLPEKHKAELLNELRLLDIMGAMRSKSQKVRDDAALKLSRLLARVREQRQH